MPRGLKSQNWRNGVQLEAPALEAPWENTLKKIFRETGKKTEEPGFLELTASIFFFSLVQIVNKIF